MSKMSNISPNVKGPHPEIPSEEIKHIRKQITSTSEYVVVDYSQFSIALFSFVELTDQHIEYFIKIGATENEYLTPDINSKRRSKGWVFKKSNINTIECFKKLVNFDITSYCKTPQKFQKKPTSSPFSTPATLFNNQSSSQEKISPIELLNNLLNDTIIPFNNLETKILPDVNNWVKIGYCGKIADVDNQKTKFEEESSEIGEESRCLYEFINNENKVCIMVRFP